MNENVIVLELSECNYIGEIHQRIKETFDFPDYYGENWHAFRDAFITVGVPDKIEIKGVNSIPARLKGEIDKMLDSLKLMKQELLSYGFDFDFNAVFTMDVNRVPLNTI